MLENLKNIKFEELHKGNVLFNQQIELKINKGGIDFYIRYHLKSNSDKLIVFSNGAFNKKKGVLPVFNRYTWSNSFDENCIFIDDKTIHNTDLILGWGVGTKNRYYIQDYSEIVKKITEILFIKANDVYYYGSSAGGYMSIMLAVRHQESTAIVNNPQTIVYNYFPYIVKNLFDELFPGMSKKEVIKNYNLRLSLSAVMKKRNYIPNLYYLQNREVEFDMNNHFKPFYERLNKHGLDTSPIKYILYSDKVLGHNPISKNETIDFIKSIVNKPH